MGKSRQGGFLVFGVMVGLIAASALLPMPVSAQELLNCSASSDRTSVRLPDNTVNLSAASNNGIGVVHFSWAPPAGATLAQPNDALTTAAFANPGSYGVALNCRDDAGRTANALIAITVLPTSTAFGCYLTADRTTINWPDHTVTLRALGANNRGFNIYQWSNTPGAHISDNRAQVVNVSFDAIGEYDLRVTCADGFFSAPGTIHITVNPQQQDPLLCQASANPNSLQLPENLSVLTATSANGVGEVTYAWSQPDGMVLENPEAATTSALFANAGQYGFTLTCTDSAHRSATAEVGVNVLPPLPPLSCFANAEPSHLTLPDHSVNLSGTADNAVNGVSYSWTPIEGVQIDAPTESVTSASFAHAGNFDLKLICTDGLQRQASAVVTISVDPEPLPLSCSVLADNTEVMLPNATVNLTAITANASGAVNFLWSALSGVSFSDQQGATTDVSFSSAGDFVIGLRCMDGHLRTASTQVSIHVGANNPCAPFIKNGVVYALADTQFDIAGRNFVDGDVFIFDHGLLNVSGRAALTDTVYLAETAMIDLSGHAYVEDIKEHAYSENAFMEFSASKAALQPSKVFERIILKKYDKKLIVAHGGANNAPTVIEIRGDLKLSGDSDLIFWGDRYDTFIFNIYGNVEFSGQSRVHLAGGVKTRNVLFNLIGPGDFNMSGDSRWYCGESDVSGTFLAPERDVFVTGRGDFRGAIVGKGSIKMNSKNSEWSFDAAPFCPK